MDKFVNMRSAKIMAALVTGAFFLVHVALFFLFSTYEITPMAYFNVFSMLFYLLSSVLILKEWMRAYVVAVYFEVVLHMVCAVLCVGWGAGFQIAIIGMNVLAFYAEYMGRSISDNYVPAIPLSVIGLCMYLSAYMLSSYYPVPYSLPHEVEFALQIAWGIIVFAITAFFLQVFVLLTFNSEKWLTSQVTRDKLTGLRNRHYMADYLGKLMKSSKADRSWIAVADIDDFKRVNDTYGHNCGDTVLKTVAKLLEDNLMGAKVCRWGGEEFLLVGKLGNTVEETREQLDRLRASIANHVFWHEEQRLGITVTIGMAAHTPGASISEWIDEADKLLYEGKCSGKNQVVC